MAETKQSTVAGVSRLVADALEIEGHEPMAGDYATTHVIVDGWWLTVTITGRRAPSDGT
jgi:hypothetical protein